MIKDNNVCSNVRNRCDVDISKDLRVELTIPKGMGNVQKIFICVNRYGERPSITKELVADKGESESDRYLYYHVDVKFNTYGIYYYFFKIEFIDKEGIYQYKAIKIDRETRKPVIVDEFQEAPYWVVFVRYDNSDIPDWAEDVTYYQIIVDRFCKSDKVDSGKLEFRNYRGWNEYPDWRRNRQGEFHNNDFFCGNLKGIEEKLDYLRDLGIGVLYLSPINESLYRYERYASTNHMKIDPDAGDFEDLKSLHDKAKEYGMHIVLDIALNHCSVDNPIFQDAISNPNSPYRGWFYIDENNNYRYWYGEFRDMPIFNQHNPGFQNYVYGEGGVIDTYSKYVDGFRLDVAEELEIFFIRGCRERANANGAHIMIGEYWNKASHDVLGNALDTVTNYIFTDAVYKYVIEGNITRFMMQVTDIMDSYPQNTLNTMLNSLDTHDTVRALTILGGEYMRYGEDRSWDIDKDPSPWHYNTPSGRRFDTDGFRQFEYDNDVLKRDRYEYAKKLIKVCSMILFFMSGCPCLYYGTEIGMHGYKDPNNRKPFPWDRWDIELFEFFKRLIHFRNGCVLKDGFWAWKEVSKNCIIFTITNSANTILVAVNRTGYDIKINLPEEYKTCKDVFLHNADQYHLGAYGGLIIRK